MMRITIAICTFNHCRLLQSTLESLVGLEVPANVDWEVLVVNNRSTDATVDTVDSFTGRLPVRMVYEGQQGLAHARNRAVQEMRGDYVIWIDDDVRVSKGWLSAYSQAFQQYKDAAFFGGPVLPWFEGTPPQWLKAQFDALAVAYSVVIPDPNRTTITLEGEIPIGANLAFPYEVQKRLSYSPELGRKGQGLMGGEETELIVDLLEDGRMGRWVHNAPVEHCIPEERQTLEFVRALYRAYGKSQMVRVGPGESRLLWNRPRWAWRAAVEFEVKYWVGRIVAGPERWVPLLKKAAYSQGVLMWTNREEVSE